MNVTRINKVSKKTLYAVETTLACIPSPTDFDDFHEVMGLVYIETFGTEAGFKLLNEWAKSGDIDLIPTDSSLGSCWCAYDDPEERYFGLHQLRELATTPARKPAKKH